MEQLDLTVTVDRPMDQARTEILNRIDTRMQSVGFAGHDGGDAVTYRPKFIGLVLVWLVRRLQGEHVTLAFEQQGVATDVRVTGKLRTRARTEVTEAFGGR